MRFRDRRHAGVELARLLHRYARMDGVVVLALPRGGVPVGFEIARALGAPLDVFVVRKVGVPGHEELAMGAVASGGVRVTNPDVIQGLQLSEDLFERLAAREAREVARREGAYRGDAPPVDPFGAVVILVDDGLATGASMRAAVAAVRRHEPERVVVAVPVGAPETCRALEDEADEVVCPVQPELFWAVGAWFDDFTQVEDDEVRALLAEAAAEKAPQPGPPTPVT